VAAGNTTCHIGGYYAGASQTYPHRKPQRFIYQALWILVFIILWPYHPVIKYIRCCSIRSNIDISIWPANFILIRPW
jgi:hypothetical protein